MENHNFSIVITGEWPGTGQSTTAKLLATQLGFERVYAGFLFRKFAYLWSQHKASLSWGEFETKFKNNQLNFDTTNFTENDFNESILHQWQHQLKSVKNPDLWDKLLEKQSLHALQRPHTIVEAKLGVLVDKIGLGNLNNLNHKIYKILLICPPEIAAHRVIKRKIEMGELQQVKKDSQQYQELIRKTTTEIINRHLRDWERYQKIYHVNRTDIYDKNIIQVTSGRKTPQQVVDEILHITKSL